MRALFKKFKDGFIRQTPAFQKAFTGLFKGNQLDALAVEELEEILYTADFGHETVEEILDAIQKSYRKDKSMRGEQAAQIGASVLKQVLQGAEARLYAPSEAPEVICLVGVNGSGKTTTAAKLAHNFSKQGHSVLLGACDTFRAAANEQIKSWADRLQIELVSSHQGADAAAVAFDSYQAAKKRSHKFCLLDTAGRLHNKGHLMQELEKLRRVLQKQAPNAPHHSWLVVDGSLGSNSIEQARIFNQSFPLTGLIITKLDGSSRGGALVGIYRELKLPIYYVGLGEQADDLQAFSVDNYAQAIFGLSEASSPSS